MRYLHPVGMAKGKARRSIKRSASGGFWGAFWAWFIMTAILAGLAGQIWKPLFYVVMWAMIALGVLAIIGSLLPDSKPPKPKPDMAVLEPSPAWTPPAPRSMGTLRRSDRASDENREQVVTRLQAGAREGRIDSTELEDRIGKTYHSKTIGELDDLLGDLP